MQQMSDLTIYDSTNPHQPYNPMSPHLQFYSSRHHNGPEGEGMRADGCKHDGRDGRVDHGGPSSDGVCSAARRCGDDETCGVMAVMSVGGGGGDDEKWLWCDA